MTLNNNKTREWQPPQDRRKSPRSLIVPYNCDMPLITTYRVKAYLTKAGHRLLDQRLEEQRLLYNCALEERLTAWRMGRVSLGKTHQSRELTGIRADFQEFSEVHRRVSVGTLDRLDRAYRHYKEALAELVRALSGQLEGAPRMIRWDAHGGRWRTLWGQPRFKSPERFRTLECHAGTERFLSRSESGRKGHIRIKGLPRLEFRWDRRLPAASDGKPIQPSYVTLTRTPKRVTISLCFAVGESPEKANAPPQNPVGLHPGVVQRMTATGIAGPVLMERRDKDRRTPVRLQRKMARQQRDSMRKGLASWERTATGSFRRRWHPIDPSDAQSRCHGRGYRKTRLRLAKFEQAQRETNMGLLHEISSRLVREHDAICIEVPDLKDMTRSASGNVGAPGEGVSRQRRFNRSVLDQTWGAFTYMLEYKAERAGIPFVRVPAPYMSQTCHRCGIADSGSRQGRAHFRCVHCGLEVDAEYNAARNVLDLGLAMLAQDAGGTVSQR